MSSAETTNLEHQDLNKPRLKIKRIFTKQWAQYEYNDIQFVTREAKFTEDQGRIQVARNVIAPLFWSQNAIDIVARIHLRRAGVPQNLQRVHEDGIPVWLQKSQPEYDSPLGEENSIAKLMDRMAGAWTYWGWKGNYFDSEGDARAFYDECRYILIHQKACANSPQLFNTGINWAYGIKGEPQGHYYVDPITKEVCKSKSAYERPQAHACFILSIKDRLLGDKSIMNLAVEEARIFKFGSGTGANFSSLRAKGEKLSSGGSSSGLMSFLGLFDAVAASIKSGGSTRRAAKMVVVNVDHPEIFEFANWKTKEEDKVVSLIVGSKVVDEWLKKVKVAIAAEHIPEAHRRDFMQNPELQNVIVNGSQNHIPMGYISRVMHLLKQGKDLGEWEVLDSSYNSEAYLTVSGQNSNNSISVTNDFMNAVFNDDYVDLKARTTGEVLRRVRAKELFESISTAAWKCGDPALQFNTTMNERTTCIAKVDATNPCSEYVYKSDTPCNLGSVNLCAFFNDTEDINEVFSVEEYAHVCRIWTIVLEISVYMSHYPSPIIAENAYKTRTVGLGYANLGGLLIRMCLPYDSDEARAWAGYLAGLMNIVGYQTSAEMASILGAFEEYAVDKEKMLGIVENHIRSIKGEPAIGFEIQPMPLSREFIPNKYLAFIDQICDYVLQICYKSGFRNAQITVIAPTGTIGPVMEADEPGMEPPYSLVKNKKMVGGGYMKFTIKGLPIALKRLKYLNEHIEEIEKYVVGSGDIQDAPHINVQKLISLGITEADVQNMNNAVSAAFNLDGAINYYNLSEESMNNLKLNPNSLPKVSLLEFLGFRRHEIEEANSYSCGNHAIEGAPYLDPKHYPIFACAVKCGKKGKQFVSPSGHVKMMIAIQPNISGAISKTVNMPEESTIQDIMNIYEQAWRGGVKAIAVFRDSSKLSSVFQSEALNEIENIIAKVSMKEGKKISSKLPRGVKEVLPAIRTAYNIKGKINGKSIYWNVGFKDGHPKEIFITADSGGGEFRSIMSCFAKALSLALQYGAPLEELIKAFEGAHFEPSGMVKFTGLDGREISMFVNSPVDYMVQVLAKLSQQSHHIGTQSPIAEPAPNNTVSYNYNNYNMGYTGDFCSNCGSNKMIRDGMCKKCEVCGTTTGCG